MRSACYSHPPSARESLPPVEEATHQFFTTNSSRVLNWKIGYAINLRTTNRATAATVAAAAADAAVAVANGGECEMSTSGQPQHFS